MSVKRKLMSNTFYIFLDWLTLAGLNFLYWIIAGKLLLPGEYGIASTTISFITIISSITMFGLTAALVKLIPEYQAKNKNKKIYGIIKFSLKMFLITNIIAAILIFLTAPLLAEYVFRSEEIVIPLYISALILPFTTLTILSGSIIQGFQYMRTLFTSDFIGTIAKNILSVALILLNFVYFGPILGYLINVILITFIRFRRIPLKDKVKINKKELFFYAIPGFIGILSRIAINQSGYIILSSLASLEATGIFTLTFFLSTPIVVIPQTLTLSSFPILSQLYGKNDKKTVEKILTQLFRYSLLITLPFCLILVMFPTQIISILGNPSYLPGFVLLQTLAIANLILGIGNFFSSALYALGKPKLNRNVQIVQAILFLTTAFLLVRDHSFMAIGYAFLVVAVFTLLISFILIRKFYRVTIKIKSVSKIIVASLVFVLFLYALKPFVEGIFMIMITVFIGIVIYAFLLLVLKTFTKYDLGLLNEIKIRIPQLRSIVDFVEKIMKKFI